MTEFTNVPEWVPSLLLPVLPGGEDWEADRKIGHPTLAIRCSRLATGALESSVEWREGTRNDTFSVPLRDGTPYQGRLLFRLKGKDGPTASSSNPADFVGVSLERLVLNTVPGLVPGESGVLLGPDDLLTDMSIRVGTDSYPLPVDDGVVQFYRFVWELTRRLSVRM